MLTEIILSSVLELFVRHKFFDPAGHCLYMINDELIQVGVHMGRVNYKLTSNLASRIDIQFCDVLGYLLGFDCTDERKRHTDMLIQFVIHFPSYGKMIIAF